MIDFLIDPTTKDFDFTDNGLLLTNTEQSYQQAILLGLSLNLGEFFTHTNYGLPWLRNKNYTVGQGIRYFLGENFPSPEIFITNELDRHLTNISFVESLNSSYTYDRFTRIYTYSFTIEVSTGETIEFAPYSINL